MSPNRSAHAAALDGLGTVGYLQSRPKTIKQIMIPLIDRKGFRSLTFGRLRISAKLLEGAILVAFFTVFIHLTTSKSLSSGTLVGSACMVLVAAGWCTRPFAAAYDSARSLWTLLTALASGFWLFSFFRFMGLVEWPLGRAADIASYARLLYFHFVLSATVVVPALIAANLTATGLKLYWRRWPGRSLSIPLRTALCLSLFGVWSWAFFEILSVRPLASGPIMGLVVISLLKAIMTGATEEICYRGLIQPLAIERFGVSSGIILQSCLYAAFHMHLGEIFFSHMGFLVGVMALGLVFGVVTRLSDGIGWAVFTHTAINLVIEWFNLS